MPAQGEDDGRTPRTAISCGWAAATARLPGSVPALLRSVVAWPAAGPPQGLPAHAAAAGAQAALRHGDPGPGHTPVRRLRRRDRRAAGADHLDGLPALGAESG